MRFNLNKDIAKSIKDVKPTLATYDGVGISFTPDVGIEAPNLPAGSSAVFTVITTNPDFTRLEMINATTLELK